MCIFYFSALSTEWSGKLQTLLDTHGPIPKLQPISGAIKPSDNDPTNFGMINAPVSAAVYIIVAMVTLAFNYEYQACIVMVHTISLP